MSVKKISFKEAYLVTGWATEIKKGFAKEVIQKDWISTSGMVLFSEDMKTFSFENIPSYAGATKGVFFDYGKAFEAMQSEKQRYIKFCKDQVDEYSEKLSSLNR